MSNKLSFHNEGVENTIDRNERMHKRVAGVPHNTTLADPPSIQIRIE
jgi:hypothetical protein